MKFKYFIASLVCASLLAPVSATAWEEGDIIFRVGGVAVVPDDSIHAPLNLAGLGDLSTAGVEVDDDTQLMLTVTWMVTSNWGIEVLAASPFEHDIDTVGLPSLGLGFMSDVRLGAVEHLPPTVSVVWYPRGGNKDAKFQPFVGAGLNYWLVLEEEIDPLVASALGATDMRIDDSTGLALRAGFDVEFNENWSLNAGVWYIDIETDAQVDTLLGTIGVGVSVDPWVWGLGIGYRF